MRTLKISAKCSDMFSAIYDAKDSDSGEQYHDGYVPSWFPNPDEKHYGDYVELEIDIDTGKIINWKKPSKADLDKTFNQKGI